VEPSLKTIQERRAYLKQIEADIEAVSLAGNDQMRDIQGDIEQLEQEKARLLKNNLSLDQSIREKKTLLADL